MPYSTTNSVTDTGWWEGPPLVVYDHHQHTSYPDVGMRQDWYDWLRRELDLRHMTVRDISYQARIRRKRMAYISRRATWPWPEEKAEIERVLSGETRPTNDWRRY